MYFPLVVIRSTLTEPITHVARVYGISPSPHYEVRLLKGGGGGGHAASVMGYVRALCLRARTA